MTRKNGNNAEASKQDKYINDPDFLRSLVQTFLQEYLEAEIADHLGAGKHERVSSRSGHRNGYKPRRLNTRVGKLFLDVPQDRESTFRTELFERYQRSEKALMLSLQEMVIQGVSTRKVQKITKELCGTTFSKSCVSDWCKRLDDEIGAWLNRPLELAYPYLIVDARYEKVRRDHKVESNGVLIVKGINEEGYRDLLAVEVVNTENVSNWGDLFSRLIDRGLHGVRLVISDNHKGLRQAIDRYFQGCSWQRCQTHFMKNVLDKVRPKDKAHVKQMLREVFDAPDYHTAWERLENMVEMLRTTYPNLSVFLEEQCEDTLACFSFPVEHGKRIRTTNSLERLNQEIKRRTRVIRIFPNAESCLRLISALCIEQSEEWLTGKIYLDMNLFENEEVKEEQPEMTMTKLQNI